MSKVVLTSSVQPLYQSLYRFMEDLLEQVPKVNNAEATFTQDSLQLEIFDKELEGSMKAKNLASSKLSAGEARVQDMATEIAIAEERLRDLKKRKKERKT